MLAGAMESGWASADIQVHALLSKLVWAYLIGHAGMALLHYIFRQRSLRSMWRLDAADAVPQELTKM